MYFQSFQQLQSSLPFILIFDVVIWNNLIPTLIALAQYLKDLFTFQQKMCSKAEGIINLTNHI